jgi:glycosyltransferase involved in cell wall biosynthesis
VIDDVLVVDDGSNDGTAEAALAAGAEVVVLPENRGKGAALREAFAILFSRGFAGVVTIDADGQHLPEEVPRLLAAADGADLVLGTRDHLFREMGRVRRVSNRLSSQAISWAAGQAISDVQTGFRFYTRKLIERTGFPESGFEAESVVVVRAVRLGLRVTTTPIRLGCADGRNTSHYRPVVDSLRIAAGVLRARFSSDQ